MSFKLTSLIDWKALPGMAKGRKTYPESGRLTENKVPEKKEIISESRLQRFVEGALRAFSGRQVHVCA